MDRGSVPDITKHPCGDSDRRTDLRLFRGTQREDWRNFVLNDRGRKNHAAASIRESVATAPMRA